MYFLVSQASRKCLSDSSVSLCVADCEIGANSKFTVSGKITLFSQLNREAVPALHCDVILYAKCLCKIKQNIVENSVHDKMDSKSTQSPKEAVCCY